jgi:hypothetical protein
MKWNDEDINSIYKTVIFRLNLTLIALEFILLPLMKKEKMYSDEFKFENFINLKLNYNLTRGYKHGKEF